MAQYMQPASVFVTEIQHDCRRCMAAQHFRTRRRPHQGDRSALQQTATYSSP